MSTFAGRIIAFNQSLELDSGSLPDGISVMNPLRESGEAARVADAFYRKYYNDNQPRQLILGINPGRFGGGQTGIPFTDPKRAVADCGMDFKGEMTHEPSSEFVYKVIERFGGVEAFYARFYINSVSPLGFTKVGAKGRDINYNYYDDKALLETVRPFIVRTLPQQLDLGVVSGRCICLGTGKNFRFLSELNRQHHFFDQIIPLEHPRYVMQYKSKEMERYLDKYLAVLGT